MTKYQHFHATPTTIKWFLSQFCLRLTPLKRLCEEFYFDSLAVWQSMATVKFSFALWTHRGIKIKLLLKSWPMFQFFHKILSDRLNISLNRNSHLLSPNIYFYRMMLTCLTLCIDSFTFAWDSFKSYKFDPFDTQEPLDSNPFENNAMVQLMSVPIWRKHLKGISGLWSLCNIFFFFFGKTSH